MKFSENKTLEKISKGFTITCINLYLNAILIWLRVPCLQCLRDSCMNQTKDVQERNCSYKCYQLYNDTHIWDRVKSSIFGHTAKFRQRPCLLHISNIRIKNKLTKQTVKILMRWLIRSHFVRIYTVCKCVSEFT